MIQDIESALKYFAGICDEKNVPVGITVSTSGRFFVKYSLSETPVCFDDLTTAVKFIIDHRYLTMTEKR